MAYELEDFLTFSFLVISLVVVISAQIRITSHYQSYKKKKNKKGLTGCEIAREILDSNGLSNVYVVVHQGTLSDYYDISRKVIRLSYDVFHGDSISALAIAAQQCSYAIQDKNDNNLMRIRARIMPFVNFLVYLGYIGIVISILTRGVSYFKLSVAILLVVFLFHLITLSLEKDASQIALDQIEKLSFVKEEEREMIEEMLKTIVLIPLASMISLVIYPIQNLFTFKER